MCVCVCVCVHPTHGQRSQRSAGAQMSICFREARLELTSITVGVVSQASSASPVMVRCFQARLTLPNPGFGIGLFTSWQACVVQQEQIVLFIPFQGVNTTSFLE